MVMADAEPTGPGVRALKVRVGAVEKVIEELKRAMRRPAAPNWRDSLKLDPRSRGRKRDHEGKHRAVLAHIDRFLDATLPESWGWCRGSLAEGAVHAQYQTEIPPVVAATAQLNIHVGHCIGCGKRKTAPVARAASAYTGSSLAFRVSKSISRARVKSRSSENR